MPNDRSIGDHRSAAGGRLADAQSTSESSDAHTFRFSPWNLTSLITELVGDGEVPADLAISTNELLALMQARDVLSRLASYGNVPAVSVTALDASEDLRRILIMFGTWVRFDV